MPYDPEGPVAKQFIPLLVNELTTSFNIPDDAQDAADYISMLIGQGRSPTEICSDVKEVINMPIDEIFMGRVFDEIRRLEAIYEQGQGFNNQEGQTQDVPQEHVKQEQLIQQDQQYNQTQAQVQPQFEQQAAIQTSVFPQPAVTNPFQAPQLGSAFHTAFIVDQSMPCGPNTLKFPTGPQGQKSGAQEKRESRVKFTKSTDSKCASPAGVGKSASARGVTKGSGVSKDYVNNNGKTGPKKSFGLQNAANLQKVLALAPSDSINMQPFTPRIPKGRCPEFPHCKNRECPLAHPTRKCFAYPNCPNNPGTCDFLHPSEDGPLMVELVKTKQEFLDRKYQKFAAPQVTLCKYGILCSKELCPFGHPTPANQDAKVIIQKWCRENKACVNPQCEYGHSSPNYKAPALAHVMAVKSALSKFAPKVYSNKYATPRTPSTLEQCKFGLNCTSASCTKRHATSQVACRAGMSCARIDCTFNHQIEEDCRFGNECKNRPCYFRHPDCREKALFVNSSTIERTFAVAEDQVMEQATQI